MLPAPAALMCESDDEDEVWPDRGSAALEDEDEVERELFPLLPCARDRFDFFEMRVLELP